jgi:cyclopropane fatty-acyl-phospholipid synthase-like methyltransferase
MAANTSWAEVDWDSGDLQKAALRDAVYACELVSVGVASFNFFSWLKNSPAETSAIRTELRLTDRVADVMLTLFTAMGLLEKRENAFHVAPKAPEILESLSPWLSERGSFSQRPVHGAVEHVVRTGKTTGWTKGTEPWKAMMEDQEFARRFLKTMDSRGYHLARALASRLDLKDHHRLLDIAGGSGIYACEIVKEHSCLTATVLEKPPVRSITSEYIINRGCSASVDVVPGDIFSGALPSGYDVHLWSNVLHDWDTPAIRQLLRKFFDGLPSGGMIVIHDSHINEEKTGPLPIANYSVFLMTATEGQCYSSREIENCLTEAGFKNPVCGATTHHHSAIIASK